MEAPEGIIDDAPLIFFPKTNLPLDLEKWILKITVKKSCYESGSAGKFGCVCRNWDNFINEKQCSLSFDKTQKVSLQTKYLYKMFCRCELILYSDPERNNGSTHFKISNLTNPLNEIFDLSKFIDIKSELIISTGYREGIIPENKGKIEIWIISREFIKQELSGGRAKQFLDVFLTWEPDKQIGIFWMWANDGNLSCFDYVTDSINPSLKSKNLFERYRSHISTPTSKLITSAINGRYEIKTSMKKFHIHFET